MSYMYIHTREKMFLKKCENYYKIIRDECKFRIFKNNKIIIMFPDKRRVDVAICKMIFAG